MANFKKYLIDKIIFNLKNTRVCDIVYNSEHIIQYFLVYTKYYFVKNILDVYVFNYKNGLTTNNIYLTYIL